MSDSLAKHLLAQMGGIPDDKVVGYWGVLDRHCPPTFIPVLGDSVTFGDIRRAIAALLPPEPTP